MRNRVGNLLCLGMAVAVILQREGATAATSQPIVLNDDGGWCWFEDPRVVLDGKLLVAGTVAMGGSDPSRRGDIEVVSHDLDAGKTVRSTLHKNFQADDHDSPGLWLRPDGRWLALYSKHGNDERIYYRISVHPHDTAQWQPEKTFLPSAASRVTYSNPHWMGNENGARGRLYNFFRGYNGTAKPSWMFSEDFGEHWRPGGLLINFEHARNHRPYVKYAGNGKDTIHFAFTEGHPMEFDTSIFHAVYRDGTLRDSAGKPIRRLSQGPVFPSETTRVFAGDSNNIAWVHGVAVDAQDRPRVVYTVLKNAAGVPKGKAGQDLRYGFARWDGEKWLDREIGYAGSTLCAGEDDYAGGICLHPDDPDTVFISANVDPATGRNPRHFEIYRGSTTDQGATWGWNPLTPGADRDNLRPVVAAGAKGQTLLLWLRGQYRHYTNYNLELVLVSL